MNRACEWCGGPMVRRANEAPAHFAKRRFCGNRCKGSANVVKRGQVAEFTIKRALWDQRDAARDGQDGRAPAVAKLRRALDRAESPWHGAERDARRARVVIVKTIADWITPAELERRTGASWDALQRGAVDTAAIVALGRRYLDEIAGGLARDEAHEVVWRCVG